jgi:hypothetical protein
MKYLSRRCIELRFSFGLCLSQGEFDRELKRLKVPSDIPYIKNSWSSATVHKLDGPNSGFIAIVALGDIVKSLELEQVYALLVHEAVHLWQWQCELIGEDTPSKEFKAYGIQAISQELMFAYKASLKKKK